MTRPTILILSSLLTAVPTSAQQVMVLNRGDDTATILELSTGETVWRVGVGSQPHEVARSDDGRMAFVGSYGGNVIHVLDIEGRASIAQFVLSGRDQIHGVWKGRVEPVFWVTAEADSAVLEIEEGTGVVRREWDTGQGVSHMVVATPDDRKLYVANIGSGSVSVIDRTVESLAIVATGAGAEGIDMTPDGREVWVSNRGANSISVIHVSTDSVIASFSSRGDFPVKLRISPDGGQAWVSNNRSGTVALFDVATRRFIDTITVGQRPLGLAFSPDGRYALVTRPGENEVVQIDVQSLEIVRRISTGNGPDGVLWIGGANPQ